MAETCRHVREDGTRCAVDFALQDGLCWHHQPGKERERLAAWRKGQRVATERRRKGKVRTADPAEVPGDLETAADAQRWSSWAVHAQATGAIDRSTAREIQYGVRTFLMALSKAALEARIKDLERVIAEYRNEH